MFWLLLFNGIVDAAIINVNDYGTIPNINTVEMAFNNSAAFTAAFDALKSSPDGSVLLFPSDYIYYTMPVKIAELHNKMVIFDSLIYGNNDIEQYPHDDSSYFDLFEFDNITNITFGGYGRIDGQGYIWWTEFLLQQLPYHQPKLFLITNGSNLVIQNFTLSNSPNFHFHGAEMVNVLIENITAWANTTQQHELLVTHNLWDFDEDVPMFPFNTDGIDVAGRDIIIRNCSIHNYDDSVCIKPSKINQWGCTDNILVEDCIQIGGAGMSVGSVSPNEDIECIQNIVFRNILFQSPLKAIYIKTNRGTEGTGRIYNITYENIVMVQDDTLFPKHAFLWPIYIGPQQQKEPGGGGEGCFVEFIRCPTQPLVNLTHVYLRNVTAVDSIFVNPAVLNCNWTNPCTNFIFNDVNFINANYTPWDDLYVCKNVYGKWNNTYPEPHCRENVTHID